MTDTAKRIAEIEERLRNPLAIPHLQNTAAADLRFLLDRVRELEGQAEPYGPRTATLGDIHIAGREWLPGDSLSYEEMFWWTLAQPGKQVRDDEP